MKLWIDDVRPAPEGYIWCKSVNEAKRVIVYSENAILNYSRYALWAWIDGRFDKHSEFMQKIREAQIELIDIDHDAGDYYYDGGDYIKLLDCLEDADLSYPIHIHSMNPVGVANMRAIIQRNGWKEV